MSLVTMIEGVQVDVDYEIEVERDPSGEGEPDAYYCTIKSIEVGGYDIQGIITSDITERIEEKCIQEFKTYG